MLQAYLTWSISGAHVVVLNYLQYGHITSNLVCHKKNRLCQRTTFGSAKNFWFAMYNLENLRM